MKSIAAVSLFLILSGMEVNAQKKDKTLKLNNMNHYEIIKTESNTPGLKIALTHKKPIVLSDDYAVLFLHGASFPSALAFGFRMNNYSWMDDIAENGYEVYALDFLGYGNSDRYPEMQTSLSKGKPVGIALEVYKDVDKAIDFIIQKTGKSKVYLIGHSWGGYVAALYAEKFPEKIAKMVLFAAITQRNDTSAIEKIDKPYEMLSPEERIRAMRDLTPKGRVCQLDAEVFKSWGKLWLQSDVLASKFNSGSVRFPSGPSQDVEHLLHGKSYYNPSKIKVPVLIIRGEWDDYPDNNDAETLFVSLENASYKKYVVIEKGTHVMHLERSRSQLYEETLIFLKQAFNTK